MKKDSIIIAGGAGFIGKNLTIRLAKENPDSIIFVIDNFITSKDDDLDVFNEYDNISVFRIDITDINFYSLVTYKMEQRCIPKPKEIWNLACPASPKHYTKYPFNTILTCTKGVYNMCYFALKYNIPLMHTSTSEIYGQSNNDMSEDNFGEVNSFGPRSCYDEGKRIAETIIYEHIKRYGLKAYIFRLFNTFGPGMSIDDGRVIPNFIVSSLLKVPMKIYGDPKITRAFCFIEETIDKMLEVVKHGYINNPINIGSCENYYTLEGLANIINTLTGNDIQPIIIDGLKDDPKNRLPILTKLESVIGKYELKTDFLDALNLTIQYFENKLSHIDKDVFLKEHNFESYK